MSLYRFKFHECDGSTSDMSEVEASSVDDARQIAIGRAREIMASEVKQGRLCLTCWIVVSDEQGHNLFTLQFGDAIEMDSSPACGHETEEQAQRAH